MDTLGLGDYLSKALELAVSEKPEIVPLLLKAGANPTNEAVAFAYRDRDISNYGEILKALLDAGGVVGTAGHLYDACVREDVAEVSRTLSEGVDIKHALCREGLEMVAYSGNLPIVRLLVEAGVDDLEQAIEAAVYCDHGGSAECEHTDVVAYLQTKQNSSLYASSQTVPPPPPTLPIPVSDIDFPIPVSDIDFKNCSLDDFKNWMEQADDFHLIVKRRASPDFNLNDPGVAALIQVCSSGRLDLVNFLLEKGVDPDAELDLSVRTDPCLVVAVTNRHYEVVRRLIEGKANIKCRQSKPLRKAIDMRDEKMVSILIDAGATLTPKVKDDLEKLFPAIYADWEKKNTKKNNKKV